MKIVLCLDNEAGLMFNNRRQSRDSAIIKDLISSLGGNALTISEYSRKLFAEYEDATRVIPDDEFTEALAKGDEGVYFVENTDIAPFTDCITEIIAYKWNRLYPADLYCTVDFSKFTIKSENEFKGSSHEKITKAVYLK